MGKLPLVDLPAIWARDALNRGDRERGLAIIRKAVETGKAGPDTLALAEITSKRGRQPFGKKHLWYDIGQRNDELIAADWSYEARITELKKFGIADPHEIAKVLAKYNRAVEDLRRIEEENRDDDLNTG
jgi:hypothetical protein